MAITSISAIACSLCARSKLVLRGAGTSTSARRQTLPGTKLLCWIIHRAITAVGVPGGSWTDPLPGGNIQLMEIDLGVASLVFLRVKVRTPSSSCALIFS
jgi:hypothetical protein